MAKVIPSYVHELLRDLRELTTRQFIYEDPWYGYVPMDDAPTEYQIGPPVPFADLGRRDKADVIDSFISWDHYHEKGLDWRDKAAIENNALDGKPPQKWLEGTSFLDPSLRAQRREELIQETFELSRQIGFAHFLAENFDRPDPALVRLNPEERKAFLRQWWDGASERMYASYLEQVAGMSDEVLARNKETYQEVLTELGENLPGHLGDKSARHRLEAAESPGKELALSPTTVHFHGFECEVEQRTYTNGRTALVLVDTKDREEVAIATVNLPEAPLKAGEVFIKDYSENEGMLAALEKAGIVQATGETVRSGFVEVRVAKVLSPTHTRGRQDDRDKARADESIVEKTPTNPMPGARDAYRQMLAEAASATPERDKDIER